MLPSRLLFALATLTAFSTAARSALAQSSEPAPAAPALPPPAATPPAPPPPAYPPPPPGYAQPPPGYAYPPGYGYPPSYGYPPGYAPPIPKPDPSIRNHDGFYFRFALGVGFLNDTTSRTGDGRSSAGLPIEIMLGGTIAPGLVLGGGVAGGSYPQRRAVSTSTDTSREVTASTVTLGPFVDWYFDPHKGTHAQLLVGLGQMQLTEGESGARRGTSEVLSTYHGLGISAGIGHEWWIGEQWSLGVMARVDYLSLQTSRGADGTSESHTVVAPGLLMTLTLH